MSENIRYLKRGKQGDEDVYVTCTEAEASHFEKNGFTHPLHKRPLQNVTKQNTDKEEMPEPMVMPAMNFSSDEKKEDKAADKVVGNPMPQMDFRK